MLLQRRFFKYFHYKSVVDNDMPGAWPVWTPGAQLAGFSTAAGVVPCGGPKKSPRTSSIVQIIFSFWSFEISEGILRN